MSLTEQQWDLLRLLVYNYEANGGAAFHFTRSHTGTAVSYQNAGRPVSVPCRDTDLHQLRDERLVSLTPLSSNVHHGTPTQLGIATIAAKTVAGEALPSQVIAAGSETSGRPALSEVTKRKLALLWDASREKHNLTDGDLDGYDRERQLLMDTASKLQRSNPRHRDAIGRAKWLGLSSSEKAGEAWFRAIDWEYWSIWCSCGAPHETYASWLDRAKGEVMTELTRIWKCHSPATDNWFENTCRPAVEKAIEPLVKQRITQAREVEIENLKRKERDPRHAIPTPSIRRRQNLA